MRMKDRPKVPGFVHSKIGVSKRKWALFYVSRSNPEKHIGYQ